MGEPARLGTAEAQPATGPTTRIDAAVAARAAARMGATAGPAATNTVPVGRTTSATASPRPPVVQEGADRHPAGDSGAGVPARPGGVGRQATEPPGGCSSGGRPLIGSVDPGGQVYSVQ